VTDVAERTGDLADDVVQTVLAAGVDDPGDPAVQDRTEDGGPAHIGAAMMRISLDSTCPFVRRRSG
jgi:hypothetical protein